VLRRNLVTTLARESELGLGEVDRVWVLASAHGVPGLLSKLPFSTVPDTQDNTWTGMGAIQDHGLRIFGAVYRDNIED